MTAWEPRTNDGEAVGGPYPVDTHPVPRIGDWLTPGSLLKPYVVTKVHHHPESKVIVVWVSPVPRPTAQGEPVPVGGRLS